jgi:uncharacterized membrane protein
MSVYGDGNSSPPQVDLGWLSDGWTLFKQQSGTWIVAALLAGLIDTAISGILNSALGAGNHTRSGSAGDMTQYLPNTPGEAVASVLDYLSTALLSAGLFRMALRQLRGEKLTPFDFLAIGDVLLPLAGVSVIVWACTTVGYTLCVVPGLILDGLLMFAPLYVVAERAQPVEAVSRSFNTLKSQWLMAAVFFCLSMLWVLASYCLCGVGELAVIPQVILAVAAGFTRMGGGGGYLAVPPPGAPWPGGGAYPLPGDGPASGQPGSPYGPQSGQSGSPYGTQLGPPQDPPHSGQPETSAEPPSNPTGRIPRESLRSLKSGQGPAQSRESDRS